MEIQDQFLKELRDLSEVSNESHFPSLTLELCEYDNYSKLKSINIHVIILLRPTLKSSRAKKSGILSRDHLPGRRKQKKSAKRYI